MGVDVGIEVGGAGVDGVGRGRGDVVGGSRGGGRDGCGGWIEGWRQRVEEGRDRDLTRICNKTWGRKEKDEAETCIDIFFCINQLVIVLLLLKGSVSESFQPLLHIQLHCRYFL